MARRKPIRRRRGNHTYTWAIFWADLGLTPVYRVLRRWDWEHPEKWGHALAKKWPKSKHFNTFFSFLCMVMAVGFFTMPRSPHQTMAGRYKVKPYQSAKLEAP